VAEPEADPAAVARLAAEPPRLKRPPGISHASREALWRRAGLERDGEGLRELAGDEHPLVRLIATSALARTESRGAHQRSDFPDRDPRFDGGHVTIGPDGQPTTETWR
jgi:L-aspartate oxidase